MFTLLKSCLADRGAQELGEDDPEEGVKDLIETVLKKMDIDKVSIALLYSTDNIFKIITFSF